MPTNRLIVKQEVEVYANALLDAAEKEGGQEAVLRVRDQFEKVVGFMSSMELTEALDCPDYAPQQRADIARNIFAELDPVVCEVVAVMAERGDIDLTWRVWESFKCLLEEKLKICVVEVTTVVPLDDSLRQTITKKAESDLGMNVVLREHIDTSILGGIIMSANGRKIDASLSSQIANARNVLDSTTVGGEC